MKKRGYCFTWNNYRPMDERYLGKLDCRYLVYGREIAPTTKTPHLQGFIYFRNERSWDEVRKLLAPSHVEPMIDNISSSANYCKKGEQSKEEWKTLGIDGTNFGKNASVFEKGEQPPDEKSVNKIEEIKEKIINGDLQNIKEIMIHYPNEYLRYNKAMREMLEELRPKPDLKIKEELRLFQKKILTYINDSEPHSRAIIWICDTTGGAGKSDLASHLVQSHGFLTFNNGKTADIAYAWNGENVIFDLARSQQEHINYEAIEQIKNGRIFSPKFNSMMKMYKRPHVLVFSNKQPNYDKMSMDRWFVYNMTPDFDLELITGSVNILELSNVSI